MTGKAEQKSFTTPDETRAFGRGTLDLVQIGGADIGLLTLRPGWRWSEHVRPLAGTPSCEAPHFQYHIQGTLHVVMDDGTEFDARPGDVTALPQGHDAWVVGRNRSASWTGTGQATTPAANQLAVSRPAGPRRRPLSFNERSRVLELARLAGWPAGSTRSAPPGWSCGAGGTRTGRRSRR
jgi:hypothetical protein